MHNWVTPIFLVIILLIIDCMKYTHAVGIFLIGMVRASRQSGAGKFVTLSECNKPGLSGCTKTPSDDNCTECSLVFLQCITGSSNTFLYTYHVILMRYRNNAFVCR